MTLWFEMCFILMLSRVTSVYLPYLAAGLILYRRIHVASVSFQYCCPHSHAVLTHELTDLHLTRYVSGFYLRCSHI